MFPVFEIAPVMLPPCTMPEFTLSWPVNVLALLSVNVPPPVLFKSAAPEICPFNESCPTSTRTVLGALRLIGPAQLLVPARLSRVPPLRRESFAQEESAHHLQRGAGSDQCAATVRGRCDHRRRPGVPATAAGLIAVPFSSDAFAVVVGDNWLLLLPSAELFWMLTTPPRMLVCAGVSVVPRQDQSTRAQLRQGAGGDRRRLEITPPTRRLGGVRDVESVVEAVETHRAGEVDRAGAADGHRAVAQRDSAAHNERGRGLEGASGQCERPAAGVVRGESERAAVQGIGASNAVGARQRLAAQTGECQAARAGDRAADRLCRARVGDEYAFAARTAKPVVETVLPAPLVATMPVPTVSTPPLIATLVPRTRTALTMSAVPIVVLPVTSTLSLAALPFVLVDKVW